MAPPTDAGAGSGALASPLDLSEPDEPVAPSATPSLEVSDVGVPSAFFQALRALIVALPPVQPWGVVISRALGTFNCPANILGFTIPQHISVTEALTLNK